VISLFASENRAQTAERPLFLLRTLAATALTQPARAPHNPGVASLVLGAQVPFCGSNDVSVSPGFVKLASIWPLEKVQ
jgi:hypothetical protein